MSGVPGKTHNIAPAKRDKSRAGKTPSTASWSREENVVPTATMEGVQARLSEILDSLAPGEEVVITRDGIAAEK